MICSAVYRLRAMPTPLVQPGSSHRIWTSSGGAGQARIAEHPDLGYNNPIPNNVVVAVRDPRYQQFLRRLRAAREDAALTQAAVADKLGKPQSYVSKCESGERRVDLVELLDFARVYRQEISFFLPDAARRRFEVRQRLSVALDRARARPK